MAGMIDRSAAYAAGASGNAKSRILPIPHWTAPWFLGDNKVI